MNEGASFGYVLAWAHLITVSMLTLASRSFA